MRLLFSITSYPAEIAYFNSPNGEISNGVRVMELYWNRIVDPPRSPCLKIVNRKRFECCNFLVLRPVLLKIAYFNSAKRQLSNDIWPKELGWRNIVDPSRGASLGSIEQNFSVFRQKIKRAVIFYLLANHAETAYLRVQDWELSNAVWLVEFWRRKVAVYTFLGVVPSRAAQMAFVPKVSKTITFLS